MCGDTFLREPTAWLLLLLLWRRGLTPGGRYGHALLWVGPRSCTLLLRRLVGLLLRTLVGLLLGGGRLLPRLARRLGSPAIEATCPLRGGLVACDDDRAIRELAQVPLVVQHTAGEHEGDTRGKAMLHPEAGHGIGDGRVGGWQL